MHSFTRRRQRTSSTRPDSAEAPTPIATNHNPAVNGILRLQRTIGNHAVQRLLGNGAKEAELPISSPGDRCEREADRVADQVLGIPESRLPPVQAGNGARSLQASPAGGPAPAAASSSKLLPATGRPLEPVTRSFFEPRFGYDFNNVRIHTGADGHAAARSVNARAYTIGQDIVFGKGEYAPDTMAGRRLLAHELTHVIQQGAAQRAVPLAGNNPGGMANGSSGYAIRRDDSSLDAPAIARQEEAEAPAISPRQRTYNDALARLQRLNSRIHGYLAAAPTDGAQTTILTNSETSDQGVTTTTNFRLTVRFQNLPNAHAVFQRHRVEAPAGSGNARSRTVDMTMLIDPPAGANAVAELTETLYHEGLHMLIHMDGFLPAAQQSPHGARLATYRSAARRHADFPRLGTELSALIQPHFRSQVVGENPTEPVPPAVEQRIATLSQEAARSIVADLIEEKYIEDTVATGMGRPRKSNTDLALEVIGNELVNELGIPEQQLVSGANRTRIQSIMARAARILAAIEQPRQPAPAPAPSPSPGP